MFFTGGAEITWSEKEFIHKYGTTSTIGPFYRVNMIRWGNMLVKKSIFHPHKEREIPKVYWHHGLNIPFDENKFTIEKLKK